MMEIVELIERLNTFLGDVTFKPDADVLIDYTKLIKDDLDLAEELSEIPVNFLKACEIAIKDKSTEETELTPRIINFDEIPSNKLKIRDVRTKHLNRFWAVEGTIRQISDVKPLIVSVTFECPLCGNLIRVLQLGKLMKELSQCGCGRKGKFIRTKSDMIDTQRMILEENIETLEGTQQPKKLNILLQGTLTNSDVDFINTPGTKIIATGILLEVPTKNTQGEPTEREFMLEANYIKPMSKDINVEITPEEVQKIKDFAMEGDVIKKLVSCYAPTIYGHELVKEAIILQLFGGVTKRRDKEKDKGEIHLFLIGDPGSGKSAVSKYILNIAPKVRYSSGARASGVGLTASLVKDEFIGSWGIEAGVMVLCNGGIVVLDEMDKMAEEDRQKMLESLSEGIITIDKASIHATLVSETSLLAIANPKGSRFDPVDDLSGQINMPLELLNRFDIIFPIRDVIDKEYDTNVINKLLKKHQGKIKEEIDFNFIKKYIIYAKKNVTPKLTKDVVEMIKSFYIEVRQQKQNSGQKVVPITARQGETIIKLSEASAKARLSNEVEIDDFERAKKILMYSLKQLALDEETGVFDIDKIETGVSTKTRNKFKAVMKVITDLENKLGNLVPIDDVVAELKEKEDIEERDIEEIINKLMMSGEIMEPRRGFLKVLK